MTHSAAAGPFVAQMLRHGPRWFLAATVFCVGMAICSLAFGQAADQADPLTLADATDQARDYGVRMVWALLIGVVVHQVIKAFVFVLERLAERHARRRLFYKRLVPICRLLIWTFAAVFIVRVVFNIDAQGLLAAAAAIGLAIGFATQGILKNIVGGLVIVADRPFQVGDKIEVAGTYGEVISIGLRSTRIQTPDDSLVSVPNAQVIENQVSNANSGQLDCQVVTDLYLPGWVDEGEAKKIAYETAVSSKYTYLRKPVVVIVKDEFSFAHVVHLRVKAYVLDARFEFLMITDITERAREAFRAAGLLSSSAAGSSEPGDGSRSGAGDSSGDRRSH